MYKHARCCGVFICFIRLYRETIPSSLAKQHKNDKTNAIPLIISPIEIAP